MGKGGRDPGDIDKDFGRGNVNERESDREREGRLLYRIGHGGSETREWGRTKGGRGDKRGGKRWASERGNVNERERPLNEATSEGKRDGEGHRD